jgi:hypothetical protein
VRSRRQAEAAAISGRADDEQLDLVQPPLIEAGEGIPEGFELAEEDVIETAEHTDGGPAPLAAAFTAQVDRGRPVGEYGKANREESSEVPDSDR